MKKSLFILLFCASGFLHAQQHLFYGIQLDYGPFFRTFEQNRDVLRGDNLGRTLNLRLSGSYRVFDRLTFEAGANLNGIKWRLKDQFFEDQNDGFEALTQINTRFISFYGSLKYSYELRRKQYLFLRNTFEHSIVDSKTITESQNFAVGTETINATYFFGNSFQSISPEIGFEYFNDAGDLITLGLKYNLKFSGDDLVRGEYRVTRPSDTEANVTDIVVSDEVSVSGSYIALTAQFNGLLSYKAKKERIKKKKKEKVVKADPEPIVEQVDTTKDVVKDKKTANDRDFKVTHKVKVKSETVKIYIWDHQLEDGDRVNLILNDEWILTNYTLKNKKLELTVTLKEGKNDFILYALNLGKYEPNTAAVIIDDGVKENKVILESTLDESGAIEIKFEK